MKETLGGFSLNMGKLLKNLSENNILKVPFLRNILLASLVIVIVLPLFDTLFIYPAFTKLLTSDKRTDAIRIARHLSSILVAKNTDLTKNLLQAQLSDEMDQLKEARNDFELVKLKFFSKSGEIIFSSDPKDIGDINNEKYFHEIVANGKVYAEVIQKDTESLEGQKMPADVVETYVPLMQGKEFLGAFEIYYDITAKKAELDFLLSRSSTLLFASAFALFLVIIITLLRENRTIRERNRAETDLRKSEERFRETTDLLPSIICETTTDGTITYLNKAGVATFAYPQVKLRGGNNITDLVHPEDRDRAALHISTVTHGEKLVTTEWEMIGEDGSERFALVNLSPMSKEGKVVGLRGSITDITEQKTIQARLQEAQKMEAIATLAGGIAHEFNNALCAVIPNIDLLRSKVHNNEEINKHTQPIQNSAKRMAHLTNQLLAYARGGIWKAEQISLNNLVQETLPFMQHLIKAGIVVETDLTEDSCYVEADRTQMQMVLLAVMVNAAEAIEASGYIRLTVGRKEIDGEFAKGYPDLKPGSYVSLTVEDNGSGMSEETSLRVFEPFFTTKFLGRGLGMAAAYGIIKSHHGLVTVDSKLGRGTVVRIYLPESQCERCC
ncbi:MAG: PAS domain S-box protein [Deltaproteobacteria bacterium]